MAWYKAGNVTVTNGSATVTGAGGTSFVSNVVVGDAFQAPDGRSYEIAAVVSATELTLARPYMGATGGGQAYTIQPTSIFAGDLAARVVTLIGSFGAVRDGIGQGLIADGSVTTPGIRFAADPDTGLYRPGENAIALVGGGVTRIFFDGGGRVGFGTTAPASNLDLVAAGSSFMRFRPTGTGARDFGIGSSYSTGANFTIYDYTALAERLSIDPAGNVLLGASSGTTHTIKKGASQGDPQLIVFGSAQHFVGSGSPPAAASAMLVSYNTSTGRSISAGGTINASGADYAEYMTKADSCGMIAAGDVCGVDRDGRLTRTWADAVSFVVKSTNPAYVGGDTWSAHMPPKPEAPVEPPAPTIPAQPSADATEEDEAAWVDAMQAYGVAQAAFTRDHAAWEAANAAYSRDLAAWDSNLEAARITVDRIAFAGQVPVNCEGTFEVGDYLIAAANGGGIKAVAVGEADITFEQYRRRLGKVWASRDGRPWIDVQHG